MAKRSAFRFSPRPIVVRSSSPRPIIKVSAPRAPIVSRRTRQAVSRFAHTAARAAYDERHRVVACIAAGFVGYAKRENWNIPHIDMLGVPATWGLGLWALQKSGFVRNKTISHATTGLLAVAAYEFGAGETVLKFSK